MLSATKLPLSALSLTSSPSSSCPSPICTAAQPFHPQPLPILLSAFFVNMQDSALQLMPVNGFCPLSLCQPGVLGEIEICAVTTLQAACSDTKRSEGAKVRLQPRAAPSPHPTQTVEENDYPVVLAAPPWIAAMNHVGTDPITMD